CEANGSQSCAGGTRPLELQPCAHQGAAGNVRTQLVQCLDMTWLDRPAGIFPLQADAEGVAGGQLDGRTCRPSESARIQNVPVERVVPKFLRRVEVGFGDETAVADRAQACKTLAPRDPATVHQ